jgi:two-component system cell cycle sensor histidine kinase/response regulator CckA
MTDRLDREDARFRIMTERGSDVAILLRSDGTIVAEGPSQHHVLGYQPGELVGRSAFDMVHPDDLAQATARWQSVLAQPGVDIRTNEYRVRHANGTWLYVESIVRNLLGDPGVNAVLVNSRDISDRRAAMEALRATEEQYRQAQKMEAVGRLAGGIAHDFNNLFTTIQGYTRLLFDELGADSPLRADLEQVQQGAERAANLTSQLLAFSRRQFLQPRVLNLNEGIVALHDMLARLAGERIRIALNLDPAIGSVHADPGQIDQVVVNLVVNAREAMPDGGVIEIATANTTITAEESAGHSYPVQPGEYVELIVRDTGTGISSHVLPHIFEPFYTTKDTGQGSGLGLSTVFGIIKQSGGYVWVDTEPGTGTALRICLPRVTEEARPAATPVAAPASTGGETILVVDDEDAVRNLARRILERAGFHVLAAGDGTQALELSRNHDGEISLILTDVVMPGMNGRDVVELVRAQRPSVKAIFTSGYTQDTIVDHGVVDADIEFISKPYDPRELARRVRDVLDTAK